jgi:hypothetical protein
MSLFSIENIGARHTKNFKDKKVFKFLWFEVFSIVSKEVHS